MLIKEELEEWQQDIRRAENTPDSHFANGPFIKSLFKTSQNISGVGQQIIYLSDAVNSIKTVLNTASENIKSSSESSTQLTKALNKLTRYGVIAAWVAVLVAFGHLILEAIKYIHG